MKLGFQGPEGRRLLAELQQHPGWALMMEWLEFSAKESLKPMPVEGADWPLKRAFQDGESAGLDKLKSMLQLAAKYPGKVDARGNLIPVEFDADGEDGRK